MCAAKITPKGRLNPLSIALFCVLTLMPPAAAVCHGAYVTLAWDANADPGVQGYKLHYGTASGVYTASLDVGKVTQYRVGGLQNGQTYYFAATAYDNAGNSSGFSAEISHATPVPDGDGDGIDDGADAFPADPAEWVDSDNDGIGDNADVDDDGDSVADHLDAFPLDPLEWADTDRDAVGNNADTDDDNDGLPDEWELANRLDPLVDDAAADPDGDGYSNIDEYLAGGNPVIADSNRPPDAPMLLAPAGGEIVSVTTQLTVDDFRDPDSGDFHARTQWQVMRAGDDYCVFDLTSTTAVTTLQIPMLILDEDDEYYWRVRYYDNHGDASAWSQREFFVTEYLGDDGDGDGVPDGQEVGFDVDLDRNGVFDQEQPDIRCVVLDSAGTQLGIGIGSSSSTADIISLSAQDPADIGVGNGGNNRPREIPFGLINFKIQVARPGEEAVICVYFSRPAPKGTIWYKYDPVEDTWFDFSAYTNMSTNRKSLLLTVIDGGEGDADGIANGVIVDPAGLVIPADSSSVSDISGSVMDKFGVGGCFISASSAAMPSPARAWHQVLHGRETACGFAFFLLLLTGRRALSRLARMIRERMDLATGARLRSP